MTSTDQHMGALSSYAAKLYFWLTALVGVTLVLPLRFNAMAIGLMGVAWVLSRPWERLEQLKENKIALPLIGFYALYILGLLHTANLGVGLKELEFKLAFLVLPLMLTTGPRLTAIQLNRILRYYAYAVLVLCLLAVGLAFFRFSTGETELSLMSLLTYRELSIPAGFDPIYMALYIIMAFFIILRDQVFDADLKPSKPISVFVWLQLIGLYLMLIFLSSRMEILVFLTALGFLMLLWGRASGRWLKPVLIALMVPLLSLALISVNKVNKARFTEMVDLEADYTENKWGGRSIRIEKWKNALECWQASPVIGLGSGDVMDELMKVYERNEFDLAISNYFNPHNQYLQLMIAFGLLGVLYFLYLLFVMTRWAWIKNDWLLLLFIIVMALSIVTESMLERQKGVVFFVFFAMILSTRGLSISAREEV